RGSDSGASLTLRPPGVRILTAGSLVAGNRGRYRLHMLRRAAWCAVPFLSLLVIGCGSDPEKARTEPEKPGGSLGVPVDADGSFSPPPAKEGYTRIVAPLIEGIEPGADQQYCQYVYAPQD